MKSIITFFVLLFISSSLPSLPRAEECSAIQGALSKLSSSVCQQDFALLCSELTTPDQTHGPDPTAPPSTESPRLTNAPNPTAPPPTESPCPTDAPVASSSSMLRRVIYIGHKTDKTLHKLPDVIRQMVDLGYTHIMLAFYVWLHEKGARDKYWDAAEKWMALPPQDRQALLDYAHSKGAKLMLSAGGGTAHHNTLVSQNLVTGAVWGATAAQRALDAGLDGLDIDSEGWSGDQMERTWSGVQGPGLKWLIEATKAARERLGKDKQLSHAPQGPYFNENWSRFGGYPIIDQEVGDLIDFYFIQYYNNGYSWSTPESLMLNSTGEFKWTAVQELKVPLDKIVVGKFVGEYVSASNLGNGSSGYMTPEMLRESVCLGHKKFGFRGGAGVWVYDPQHLDEVEKFGRLLTAKC